MKQSKPFDVALISLILLSCFATAVLTLENNSLKAKLTGATPIETGPSAIGSTAVPIRIKTLDDHVDSLSFHRRAVPTIIFIFTTTCPHCEDSYTAWRSSSLVLDSSECSIVGISLDDLVSTRRWEGHEDFPFDIVVNADTALWTHYRIDGVPQTIVVSRSGRITHVWRGRFDLTMVAGLVNAVRDSSYRDSGGAL